MKVFFVVISILIIIGIYGVWLLPGVLSRGDNHFAFSSTYQDYTLVPQAWDTNYGYGLGRPNVSLLWISFANNLPIVILGQGLGQDWQIIERAAYFLPFLIIAIFSVYRLLHMLHYSRLQTLLGIVVFLTSTYILMIVSGQILVGLSIAIVPLVIAEGILFFGVIFSEKHNVSWKVKIFRTVVFSVLLTLLSSIDLRFFYLTIMGIAIIYIVLWSDLLLTNRKALFKNLPNLFLFSGLAGIVFLLLNAYWILPLLFFKGSVFEDTTGAYTTLNAVNYFSFADFEHTLGLLHPNWPDNIFGKTSFMKAEFLIYPILAMGSLLFHGEKTKKVRIYLLAFMLLGLVGVFLAKGANEPFGGLYTWFFDNLPGFIMFRDPTKWYVFILVSYVVLIPFSVSEIFHRVNLRIRKEKLSFIFSYGLVLLFLTLITLPALRHQLTGSFAPSPVPEDYKKLERFLLDDKSFGRTLWIPSTYRYGFTSNQHPSISAREFLGVFEIDQLLRQFHASSTATLLQEANIRYVIVPFDSDKDLYIKDRNFSAEIPELINNEIVKSKNVQEVSGFDSLRVYRVPNIDERFRFQEGIHDIKVVQSSSTSYSLSFPVVSEERKLIFSDQYHVGWEALIDDRRIVSEPYHKRFNSFLIPKGTEEVTIYYTPQKWVDMGLMISIGAGVLLIGILGYIVISHKKIT